MCNFSLGMSKVTCSFLPCNGGLHEKVISAYNARQVSDLRFIFAGGASSTCAFAHNCWCCQLMVDSSCVPSWTQLTARFSETPQWSLCSAPLPKFRSCALIPLARICMFSLNPGVSQTKLLVQGYNNWFMFPLANHMFPC